MDVEVLRAELMHFTKEELVTELLASLVELAKVSAPGEYRPHKVMTAEEYAAMPIIGWHEVCRDVDSFGGVGVRFLGLSSVSQAQDKTP